MAQLSIGEFKVYLIDYNIFIKAKINDKH